MEVAIELSQIEVIYKHRIERKDVRCFANLGKGNSVFSKPGKPETAPRSDTCSGEYMCRAYTL